MTMWLIPYFVMNGNAREAIQFYERALGAKLKFVQPAADMSGSGGAPVTHATLQIGQSTVMIRDAAPGETRRRGDQISIALATYDVDEARRIFNALQEDGTVHVPLQETPFSPAHGLVTDKFGVPFQITAQPPPD